MGFFSYQETSKGIELYFSKNGKKELLHTYPLDKAKILQSISDEHMLYSPIEVLLFEVIRSGNVDTSKEEMVKSQQNIENRETESKEVS